MKNLKKILSFVLVLAMCLSLGVSAYAAPGKGSSGRIQPGYSKPQEVPEEEPVVEVPDEQEPEEPGVIDPVDEEEEEPVVVVPEEEEPVVVAPEEEEVSFPAKTFTYDEDGLSVIVNAPEGAFPEGTTMAVSELSLTGVQEIIDRSAYKGRQAVFAADISFADAAGTEIQPKEPVNVSITSSGVPAGKSPLVLHIDDNETVTEVEKAAVVVSESASAEVFRSGSASITNDTTGVTETVSEEVGSVSMSFEASSFSAFILTWKNASGTEEKATIHWGTMEDGEFKDFEEPSTLDNNSGSMSLDVIFDGYVYANAFYKETADSVAAGLVGTPILTKVTADDGSTSWKMSVRVATGEETYEVQDVTVANGSNIYVTYIEKNPSSYTPPTPAPASLDNAKPLTNKTVKENPDGTFTIRLDITGQEDSSTTVVAANVIVVFDMTKSMRYDMDGTDRYSRYSTSLPDSFFEDEDTRMYAAKTAMNTLINTLDFGTDGANTINFALAEFDLRGSVHTWSGNNWTTEPSPITTYVNSTSFAPHVSSSGTNWEGGMIQGLSLVNEAISDENLKNNKTYVIFMTDGDPNRWGETGNQGTGWGDDTHAPAAAAAAEEAAQIAANAELYGIFCGEGASGQQLLTNLITSAGGKQTIAATSSSAIEEAFGQIAQTIVNELKASQVVVDDGIPSLSNVSAAVSGEVQQDAFRYYIQAPSDEEPKTWTDAPSAGYSQSNGVTWDLSATGALVDGTTYSLEFDVWPSQEAYDMIADLNNNLIDPVPEDDELTAIGIDWVAQADGSRFYYLMTNTHLNTTFNINNNTYDSPPESYDSKPMQLPTTTVKVVKYWNNDLDDRTAIENAKILVTKDNETYKEISLGTFSKVEGYDHKWVQTPDEEIFISMGQLTLNLDTNKINVISSGHEYSVKEPEAYSHNWWLTADVYHPMLVNGEPTVLILVKEDEIPSSLSDLANNMHAKDGGKDYYKFGDKLYVAQNADENILEATNDRRSNLNITKAVSGDNLPADAFFTYNVTVTDSQGKDIWFSVYTAPENGDIIKDTSIVSGATAEEGNTGYWYFASGGTATIKIKAGWNIRFINLPNDSSYEIVEVESAMEPGWVFDKAESSIVSDYDATPATIQGTTASGDIDQANTKYIIKYTNKYLGVFYVYHSGDLSVERYPMAVNGVPYSEDKTFDIYALTLDNTLYGGYYSDYAGKSSGFDATKLTYSNDKSKDSSGTIYSYAYIQESECGAWDYSKGYKTAGTAMVPEANAVYYLKEVPVAYLLPYTHFTYYKEGYKVANLWTITAVDDLCYSDAGFMVTDVETGATIIKTMNIKAAHSSNVVSLTAGKVYKAKGMLDGYLGYADITENYKNALIQQFWVTKDDIQVFGLKQRQLNSGETLTTLKNTDSDYPSS